VSRRAHRKCAQLRTQPLWRPPHLRLRVRHAQVQLHARVATIISVGGERERAAPSAHLDDAEVREHALNLAIARRVREYRQQMGLTVGQLAERSGISKGMLSKIENAQASPSLATLARLSTAITVPVTSFFRGLEEEHDAIFVKADQGIEIVRQGTRAGHRYQLLGSLLGVNRQLEPLLVTLIEQEEVFPLFQHDGSELIYMLSGVMEYGYGSSRYVLESGDALQFDGGVPHGPTNLLRLPVKFLSVKCRPDRGD
jgi:transcriptional regulator with XRE-family HTH domain